MATATEVAAFAAEQLGLRLTGWQLAFLRVHFPDVDED